MPLQGAEDHCCHVVLALAVHLIPRACAERAHALVGAAGVAFLGALAPGAAFLGGEGAAFLVLEEEEG